MSFVLPRRLQCSRPLFSHNVAGNRPLFLYLNASGVAPKRNDGTRNFPSSHPSRKPQPPPTIGIAIELDTMGATESKPGLTQTWKAYVTRPHQYSARKALRAC